MEEPQGSEKLAEFRLCPNFWLPHSLYCFEMTWLILIEVQQDRELLGLWLTTNKPPGGFSQFVEVPGKLLFYSCSLKGNYWLPFNFWV